MAWGSDGRGGADGYSLEESHTQAVVAALVGGPFLLADQLSTLLPEERAVLEDPEVLDLAWDERGFRPIDLFDHADDGRQHAYAQPADLPSVWMAERDRGTVVALFNWTDDAARPHRARRHDGRRSRPTAPGCSAYAMLRLSTASMSRRWCRPSWIVCCPSQVIVRSVVVGQL